MTTLSLDNSLTTVIMIFRVEPEEQLGLIAAIKEFLLTVRTQPGTNGVKVANYARWYNKSAFGAFWANKLFEFATPDSHVYEIVTSELKIATSEINEGECITHFAESNMSPKNQPRAVELAKEQIQQATQQPGIISATFNCSLNSTRVVNYGQWENEEVIAELTKQPGFNKDTPYCEGLSKNEYHLYRVVHTVNV